MNPEDVCVHTIVRNGDDFIKPCLESVLPYVSRVMVTVDSRSSDNTLNILAKMCSKWDNLEVRSFEVKNPSVDLVAMRNSQLARTTERFVWIVDSDEIWPEESVKEIRLGNYGAYGFRFWAVWNMTHARKASSKMAMKIFQKTSDVKWEGKWGKERLMKGQRDLCFDYEVLSPRFIHLTFKKKDNWREELQQKRKGKASPGQEYDMNNELSLVKMPQNIIKTLKIIK